VNLKAIPSAGYYFKKWVLTDDANAKDEGPAEFSFTATGNVTYYGVFDLIPQDKVYVGGKVKAGQETFGTVTGSDYYDVDKQATLTAVPNDGYLFDKWTDEIGNDVVGSSKAALTIVVKSAATYIASFKEKPKEKFAVKVQTVSGQDAWGKVSGGGADLEDGSHIDIKAEANEGYEFVKWTTENSAAGAPFSTVATLDVPVSANVTYYAVFREEGTPGPDPGPDPDADFTVIAKMQDGQESWGNVIGGGTYKAGDLAFVKVTSTDEVMYTFVKWVTDKGDESTSATYSFTVKENVICTAVFKAKEFTIGATLADDSRGMGTVTGGGTYLLNDKVTLNATPASDMFEFDRWESDGGKSTTVNPLSFQATKDVSYVAHFKEKSGPNPSTMYTIGVTVADNQKNMGTVIGGGMYEKGKVVTLTASVKDANQYEFLQWSDGQGNNFTDNPFTFYAREDISYEAVFKVKDTANATIEARYVTAQDKNLGTFKGSDTYAVGQKAVLIAVPVEGYVFVGWYDNVDGEGTPVWKDSSYEFNVTGNRILYGKFKQMDKPGPNPGGSIDDWEKNGDRKGKAN
jgi:uncharacterized repeat protein (TIGR02543 family)